MSDLYKWVKADLVNFTNIPADETELFIKYVDAEGIARNAHGWVDTIDDSKRIRWGKEIVRGGYALKYMKSLEFLEEIKQPIEENNDLNKLIEWTQWLGEMGWYKIKGSDRWEHDDETGYFPSTKDLVEHYNELETFKDAYIERNEAYNIAQTENENLKKQLREQIAGAAISNDALLELNRKVAENIIDKAIQKCDERIKEIDVLESSGFSERKNEVVKMKTFLLSLK